LYVKRTSVFCPYMPTAGALAVFGAGRQNQAGPRSGPQMLKHLIAHAKNAAWCRIHAQP